MTATSIIALLIIAFVCRNAIRKALSTVPNTVEKTVITVDKAVTSGYNGLLMELREQNEAQAKKLGLKDTSPDAIFAELTK